MSKLGSLAKHLSGYEFAAVAVVDFAIFRPFLGNGGVVPWILFTVLNLPASLCWPILELVIVGTLLALGVSSDSSLDVLSFVVGTVCILQAKLLETIWMKRRGIETQFKPIH